MSVVQVTVPCLAAALTSLFITYNMPFIKPQQDRTDIHWKELVMIEEDGEMVILGEVPVSGREHLEDSAHGGQALAQAHEVSLPRGIQTSRVPQFSITHCFL